MISDLVSTIIPVSSRSALPRVAGRQVARGEFVLYLDSDDLLLSRKFEAQVRGLQENGAAARALGWVMAGRLACYADRCRA